MALETSRRCRAHQQTVSRQTVNERLVSGIWSSGLVVPDLLLTDWGQKLQVVYPGRPCFDHGPDFRDAIIAFDDDLRRGDVEVHCHSSDWQAHGHHADREYNAVILHVVFDVDTPRPILRADGQPIPTLEVCQRLPLALSDVEDLLHHYEFVSSCAGVADRGWVATRGMLERAGEERFFERVALVEGALSVAEPAQVLYELLFEGLGYSRNKAPFRELARSVPLQLLENIYWGSPPAYRREAVQGLLFGAAGLLPSQRSLNRPLGAEERQYVMRLEAHWSDLADYVVGPVVAHPWQFSRVRPENFPTRRVAAASELLCSYLPRGVVEAFVGVVREQRSEVLPTVLTSALCVQASDRYWCRRFDFGGRESGRDSALIGRGRAGVLVVNAVLPFVVALGRHLPDEALCRQALECYRRLSVPGGNELTRYVSGLLGFRALEQAPGSARVQQGLLHVYHNWCVEKKCVSCPVH